LVEHTTENRGVPGSSPGLAMPAARACTSPGVRDAFRVRTLPRWEDRNSGLTDMEGSSQRSPLLRGALR
jgi:hypothetical protein